MSEGREGRWRIQRNLDGSYSIMVEGPHEGVSYFVCGDAESAEIACQNLNDLEARLQQAEAERDQLRAALEVVANFSEVDDYGSIPDLTGGIDSLEFIKTRRGS